MSTGPHPRRWFPLTVLVLGLTSLLLLVVVDRLADRWTSRDLNLLHALADVQNSVTAVHLWMEEKAAGDGDGQSTELWQELDLARDLSRAMLEGAEAGEFGRSPLVPPSDPGIRQRLQEVQELVDRFILLSEARRKLYADGVASGLPAATDAEYDQVFSTLEERVMTLQARLSRDILANKRNSRYAIVAILATWLLIIVAASAALWAYERRHARAEAVLREREGQLLQAQKMEAVGRLAGGIAHDINNYLAAIRGQSELVQMKAAPGDAIARRMDMVLATADRASSLIERLLAFSRRQPVQPRTVHLNDVVSDLEPMLERLIGDDIRLTEELCSGDCTLRIDPTQVEQVIVNLLINAREAMPTGGEVRLTTRRRHLTDDDPRRPPLLASGDYVELTVSDSGSGIPEEIQDKIFEPFFTTKGEASGLGLPTVYGIVQQNGGDVEVESSPESGTTFRILLPLAAAGQAAAPDGEDDGVADDAPVPEGRGERLLVVDDHLEFLHSVRDLLEGLGYRVEVAADAETALDRCRAGAGFDLVITDVVMPGLNGRELVDRLRRRHGDQKVIFVSGYTGDVALRHGVNGESVVLLQKPFSMQVLARKVRQVLDRPAGGPASDDGRRRHAASGG